MRDVDRRTSSRRWSWWISARICTRSSRRGSRGLVHQERLGFADDRPAHRDALTLTTRECARLALQEVLDLEDLGGPLDALRDLLLRHLVELEAEGEVVLNRHVRVERVALEDHRDVPLLRREVVDDAIADPGSPPEISSSPATMQGGRLAAPGVGHQHHQFAVLDREVRSYTARVPSSQIFETLLNSISASSGPSFQRERIATPRCRNAEARGKRRRSMTAATDAGSVQLAEPCQAHARLPATVAHPASESDRLAWHPSWQLQLPRVVLAEVELAPDSPQLSIRTRMASSLAQRAAGVDPRSRCRLARSGSALRGLLPVVRRTDLRHP